MCNLRSKYSSKKNKTLKARNVGFELSFQEYKTLIQNSDVCDYTQEEFSDEETHLFRSIERIDKNLPYRKDNCCVVTVQANQIKDILEEDSGKVAIEHIDKLSKIKHTLETKSRLQLAGKYFPELLSQEENTMSQETNSGNDNTVTETHLDLSIANSYIDRCKNIQGFNISFNKYKQKYLKKTCDVTGRTFNQGQQPLKKVFIKIDENKAWQDDNVRVVCNIVKTIVGHKLFTEKELGKLVKEL